MSLFNHFKSKFVYIQQLTAWKNLFTRCSSVMSAAERVWNAANAGKAQISGFNKGSKYRNRMYCRNEVVFGPGFVDVPAVRMGRGGRRRTSSVSVGRRQLIVTRILKRHHRIWSNTIVLICVRFPPKSYDYKLTVIDSDIKIHL